MKKRMQWLIGALAIVCAVTLYSVYLAHFRGHRESGTKVDNWEEYWAFWEYEMFASQSSTNTLTSKMRNLNHKHDK